MKLYRKALKTLSLDYSILNAVYTDLVFIIEAIARFSKPVIVFIQELVLKISTIKIKDFVKDFVILFRLLIKRRNIRKLLKHINKELSSAMYNFF